MSKPDDPKVAMLRAHDLFAGLDDRELSTAAGLMGNIKLREGSTVMLEDYHGEQLLLIVEGSVEVSRDGTHLATVGAGSFVGEMGLLRDVDRSATVRAATDVKLLTVDRPQFEQLVGHLPVIRERIEAVMAERDAAG